MRNTLLKGLLTASIGLMSLSALADGIPNFHELQKKPARVFRGADPSKYVDQLKENGVKHVLIFKNDVRGEVAAEKVLLRSAGIKVKHIPFKWKELESTKKACAQTIDALNFITDTASIKGENVFFHCTVGEDRTGLLAGLYRIANQDWSIERAFKSEMCQYGFANGNRNKPAHVVKPILNELYPAFRMAVAAVEESKSKGEKPNKEYCRDEAIVNVQIERCPGVTQPE